VWRPLGWVPEVAPNLTRNTPSWRVNEGASPDRASRWGLTQSEGAPVPFIWAPWRGREAFGSFPTRGRTRNRDQISVIEHIPQGLPSENWKILGLSPLGLRGTYKSKLTQKSMGQVSLPVEECHLIRGRGHRRLLFQDRGPLGTGPPITASWAGFVLLAGRIILILSAFSSRSFRLVGVAERLRAVASDSLGLSLGEDPLGGDGGPGGPWPPSEEDVSVALRLSSSDDDGLDTEAESSEDEEDTTLAGSS